MTHRLLLAAVLALAAGPALAPGPYDPEPGTYPFFPSSIFLQKIPHDPSVNPNSSAWLARLGTLSLGKFQFAAPGASDISQDYGYPIYPMSARAPGAMRVRIHCTAGWGRCGVEGQTVYVTPRELPEDGGAPGEDSHLTLIDAEARVEYDLFGVLWPPKDGTLTAAWGGPCALDGDGYDGHGCGATATGTPLSIGIIRARDLLLAAKTPNGALPYALQTAVKCTNGKVPPMTGSDGHTAGCAPQGSRVYLAMHDAQVDAGSDSPIEKALLRTIDEDHFGMIISDTNGGQDGFSLQSESDLTYTAFGEPGPSTNELLPELRREGLLRGSAPYKGIYYVTLPFKDVDFAHKLKFL